MKFGKYLLAAALMTCGLAANAQESEQVEFNHHWFLQLQGGAAYTVGEADFNKLISPAAQIAVGYQFTPVWALRLAVNGWESKGGFADNNTYKWNHITPALDAKFNLINAIAGHNPKRVFGLNIIAGVGCNLGFNNEDNGPINGAYRLNRYWNDEPDPSIVGRVGLDLDFRLSKRVSLGLELMSNFLNDHYNSKSKAQDENPDWYFNGLLGLRIGLGKVENVIPVAVPVVVEEPAPAPVVVKETPKPQPVVKKAPEMKTEIFYAIRETIVTEAEQPKLNNLIAFLKANAETKVTVTGYADAGTGNPDINMKYSEQRAENVAKALTEAGIDANRITVDAKGDTVQPFSENDKNRVSIAIAK
ncbi:MAG: OmpA family protein [Bacteroidaceae bacterium]|nr:OmpA family protein [Bacteroidaceae bacterium]